MIKTRFTEMFGIKYPMVQTGMQWLGIPSFASAVCNAGAMGTINVSCWATPEEFHENVKLMKSLTDKPFIVNISLTPGLTKGEEVRKYIDVCAEEKVACIETAGDNPKDLINDIHAAGCYHLHKCPNYKVAMSMERRGADLVTIAGYEVAGHPSKDGVGTFIIARRVAKDAKIPVIAAGGIADGHGLAAALCLGASAVGMGTRMICTTECTISQNHKQWVLDHTEKDTVLAQRTFSMMRVARNNAALLSNEMENRGASFEEIYPVVSGRLAKMAYDTGNVDGGVFACGQGAGLINDIVPVKELVDRMAKEAEEDLDAVRSMFVEG